MDKQFHLKLNSTFFYTVKFAIIIHLFDDCSRFA